MTPYDRSWYTGFGYYYIKEALPRNCVDPLPEETYVEFEDGTRGLGFGK